MSAVTVTALFCSGGGQVRAGGVRAVGAAAGVRRGQVRGHHRGRGGRRHGGGHAPGFLRSIHPRPKSILRGQINDAFFQSKLL